MALGLADRCRITGRDIAVITLDLGLRLRLARIRKFLLHLPYPHLSRLCQVRGSGRQPMM